MTPDRRPRFLPAAPFVLIFLLFAAGCGGPGQGKVSGQVLYNGKPLPGGTIMFHPVNSKYNSATAIIDQNGNYEVTVTAGEVRICVDNRALKAPADDEGIVPTGGGVATGGFKGPPKGAALGPPKDALSKATQGKEIPKGQSQPLVGKYVAVPQKYYSPETSGLTFTVKGGSQSHNVELTK